MSMRMCVPAQAATPNAFASGKVEPMSRDRFWAVVASTTVYEDDPRRQLEALRTSLLKLSTDEVLAYEAVSEAVATLRDASPGVGRTRRHRASPRGGYPGPRDCLRMAG